MHEIIYKMGGTPFKYAEVEIAIYAIKTTGNT